MYTSTSGGFAVVEEDGSASASKFPSVSSLLTNVASVVWVLPISFNQWQIWDVTTYISTASRLEPTVTVRGCSSTVHQTMEDIWLTSQLKWWHLEKVAQESVRTVFWVFPRWRLHGLSGPAVPVQFFSSHEHKWLFLSGTSQKDEFYLLVQRLSSCYL